MLHMNIGSLDFNQASRYPFRSLVPTHSRQLGHAEFLLSRDGNALKQSVRTLTVVDK